MLWGVAELKFILLVIYTVLVFNKSAKKIHTSNYASTRRLKRKPHTTDPNLYDNGLTSRLFMCRVVVNKHV